MKSNKGTVLQIVLIIFMVLTISITSLSKVVISNSTILKEHQEINRKRQLELTILHYYKYEMVEGILISDNLTIDQYDIHYSVDDMGSYYYITTEIKSNNLVYGFITKIELETINILEFSYLWYKSISIIIKIWYTTKEKINVRRIKDD